MANYNIKNPPIFKPVAINVTLIASNWNQETKTYTFSNEYITNTSTQLWSPAAGITEAQLKELRAANIQDINQQNGSTTFKAYGTIPSINIPVCLTIIK